MLGGGGINDSHPVPIAAATGLGCWTSTLRCPHQNMYTLSVLVKHEGSPQLRSSSSLVHLVHDSPKETFAMHAGPCLRGIAAQQHTAWVCSLATSIAGGPA